MKIEGTVTDVVDVTIAEPDVERRKQVSGGTRHQEHALVKIAIIPNKQNLSSDI